MIACLLAACALLLVPGWVLGRAWGLRGLTALGSAPALTLAVLGPATLLAQRTGDRWDWAGLVAGWPTALLVLAVLLGLALVRPWRAGRGTLDRRALGRATLDRAPLAPRERWFVIGGIALAAVLTGVPVALGTGGGENPSQASDAVFHLSATAFVRATGDASFLGGLAPLYDGASVYYPTGWHAVAALLPGSVVLGSNVLVLVLAALVWPLGVTALLREALDVPAPVLAVGAALSGSVVAPLLLLTSVWPYGMSVVLLPGALALVARALRGGPLPQPGCIGARQRSAALLIAGAACLGVLMAHGAAVFNLLVLGAPPLVAALHAPARRAWDSGGARRATLLVLTGGGALVVLAGAWVMRRSLVSVFSYPRGAANLLETLYALIADHPLLASFTPWVPGNVLVLALGVLGALAWRRWPALRPWAVGCAIAVVLILLASGPAWPGRLLAGPWYTQRARIMPLVTIPLLVLATAGIEEARRRWGAAAGAPAAPGARPASHPATPEGGPTAEPGLRRRPTGWRGLGELCRARVPATVLVLSLVLAPAWRWPLKAELLEAVHDADRASYGAMLSEDELGLIHRAAGELPAGAVVVGDPSNGSAYLWSVAGVSVLYPSRPAPASGSDLRWLGDHLAEIGTDARVCRILEERGVGYYYSDSASADGATGGSRKALWGTGWDVPEEYLERIDSAPSQDGGRATLWRIKFEATPCG